LPTIANFLVGVFDDVDQTIPDRIARTRVVADR
jgi:hypothetical protein